MKLKTPSRVSAKSSHGRKIQKFSLLFVSAVVLAFASGSNAQSVDYLSPYLYVDYGVYPLEPIVGSWVESDNGVTCARSRTVEDQGCYWDDLGDPYQHNDICQYPDHAFADSQEGIYVPGTGCTNWKTTEYTWVVGGTGSAYGTGTLVDQ